MNDASHCSSNSFSRFSILLHSLSEKEGSKATRKIAKGLVNEFIAIILDAPIVAPKTKRFLSCSIAELNAQAGNYKEIPWMQKKLWQGIIKLTALNLFACEDRVDQTVVSIYQKSAQKGSAQAKFLLAGFYAEGLVVDRDLTIALSLTTQAAEQGFADAEYKLSLCYKNGTGVDIDPSKAFSSNASCCRSWFTACPV